MKKLKFGNITVRIYTDPWKYVNMPEKPFGEIPANAEFAGITDDAGSTGFTTLEDRTIRVYVDPKCEFTDLLSTVSHELGHLIEGGFKKNPPDKMRYFNKHERKAEHYEKFVMDAYSLTNLIMSKR